MKVKYFFFIKYWLIFYWHHDILSEGIRNIKAKVFMKAILNFAEEYFSHLFLSINPTFKSLFESLLNYFSLEACHFNFILSVQIYVYFILIYNINSSIYSGCAK